MTSGAALAGSAAAAPLKNQYFELEWFRLRNGTQPQRANDFFGKVYVPAMKRLNLPTVGFFQGVVSEHTQDILMIVAHPTIESIELVNERLSGDAEYQKGAEAYLASSDLPYNRRDTSLLKAFDAMPALAPPPAKTTGGARIFELRTYESNTSLTLRRKIKMFADGEIAIFKRLNMNPVFFGQTIIGRNIPNLTYMLCYDDLATREKVWRDFGADPEWQKMRSAPGNADAEIVSNISNLLLRPTAYSQIK
jgi:hypothetical protein